MECGDSARILNPSFCIYQEMHPCRAISIDIGKIMVMMRECVVHRFTVSICIPGQSVKCTI